MPCFQGFPVFLLDFKIVLIFTKRVIFCHIFTKKWGTKWGTGFCKWGTGK